MKEHFYKEFTLKRNGLPKTPWNIYVTKTCEWVGFGISLKECKNDIDEGCFNDELKQSDRKIRR